MHTGLLLPLFLAASFAQVSVLLHNDIIPQGVFTTEACESDIFWDSPQLAVDRNVAQQMTICNSLAFELKQENWMSAMPEIWLANYTINNMETPYYKRNGLVQAIAREYLGDGDFQCGLFTTSCQVDCMDVVSRVDDLFEARNIYFILKNAEHLTGVFNHAWSLIGLAQQNVNAKTAQISVDLFWSRPSYYQGQYEHLMGYVSLFVQAVSSTIVGAFSWGTAIRLADKSLEAALNEHHDLSTKYDQVRTNPSFEIRNRPEVPQLGLRVERSAQNVIHAKERKDTVERLQKGHEKASRSFWYASFISPLTGLLRPSNFLAHIMQYVKFESPEAPTAWDQERLDMITIRAAQVARATLVEGLGAFFMGYDVRDSGVTSFLELMAGGAYLDPRGDIMQFWHSSLTEPLMTKALTMRVVNYAIKTQQVWITCSSQFLVNDDHRNSWDKSTPNAYTCDNDRAGPQDLKSCADDSRLVCYMYRWNARGNQHAHRNEKPFGWEKLDHDPYNFPIKAIIESSYKSHMARRRQPGGFNAGDQDPFVTLDHASSFGEKLWDPAATGSFQVPVCITEVSWAGSIEPVFDIGCDVSPHCDKKRLPCFCGPWGNETQSIMTAAHLFNTHESEYRGRRCPLQQNELLSDSLEKWIAKCRTDVNPDIMCTFIIDRLEQAGNPRVDDMENIEKIRYKCMAGILKKDECKRLEISMGESFLG